MLIRFEVANHRSIAEPVELSMVAIDADRPQARPQPAIGESLLPVAAIYGPNASGKSNILMALTWLRDAVRDSLRFWDESIPVEPFAFGAFPREPSDFALDMAIEGVRFEYVLSVERDGVRYEGLFHYPEGRRRRIFERDGSELVLQRGLGGLSGTRELLTERSLALSIARRFDEPLVSGFARAVLGIYTLAPSNRSFGVNLRPRPEIPSTEQLLDPVASRVEDRAQALALLKLADLGVEDVLIDTVHGADMEAFRRVRLLHRAGDDLVPLEFASESQGTKTWYQLIGPLLAALRSGGPLLFDELDASLHPTLSAQLIRLFQDPGTNPDGAQLIFTSHDTSLLNHLNRDEVWLTDKRPDGSTRLGSLSEFAGERVRKSKNLESAYLHGRFGALPQVDQTELLRALGLIG